MMLWLYAGNWEYHSQVKYNYTVLANRSYLFLQLPMLETLVQDLILIFLIMFNAMEMNLLLVSV